MLLILVLYMVLTSIIPRYVYVCVFGGWVRAYTDVHMYVSAWLGGIADFVPLFLLRKVICST